MRDLEIRGPGNLLGSDQSGHIAAVGYDLYVQLVAEAVAEARGEARPTPPTVALDVPGDAHLPKDYVTGRGRPSGGLPAAWRRCRRTPTSRTSGRSGPTATGHCPAAALGLLALARLRTAAMARGDPRDHHEQRATRSARANRWPGSCPVHLAASAEVRLRRLVPGARYREDLAQLLVPIRPGELPADVLRQLLEDLIPPA